MACNGDTFTFTCDGSQISNHYNTEAGLFRYAYHSQSHPAGRTWLVAAVYNSNQSCHKACFKHAHNFTSLQKLGNCNTVHAVGEIVLMTATPLSKHCFNKKNYSFFFHAPRTGVFNLQSTCGPRASFVRPRKDISQNTMRYRMNIEA